jgi:hypothetical protein
MSERETETLLRTSLNSKGETKCITNETDPETSSLGCNWQEARFCPKAQGELLQCK